MLFVQITLLAICLIIVNSYELENSNISDCFNDWIQMTDKNYAETVDRYKKCLDFSNRLKGEDRRKFQSKMGEHLLRSCKSFLEITSLPPKELVRAVRNIVRMVEPYLEGSGIDDESTESVFATLHLTTINVQTQPENQNITNQNVSKMEVKLSESEEDNDDDECTTAKVCTTEADTTMQSTTTCQTPATKDNRNKLYAALLLYGFLLLILLQLLLLFCLIYKCLMYYRSLNSECPASNLCSDLSSSKSGENFEKDVQPIEVHHCIEIRSQSEATPSTSAEMTANRLSRNKPSIKFAAELSSISSSDLGSDSEFEALMKRRPLLEKKKRKT